MDVLTQHFRFPKRLWLLLSLAFFIYLFLGVAVNYKDNQPTAWRALLDGDVGMGAAFAFFWLAIALVLGAFAATVIGLARQLVSSRRH